MTYVTGEKKVVRLSLRVASLGLDRLFFASDFRFQSGEIRDGDALTYHLDQSFGLETAEVAGDQLADGANLRGEFMVANVEFEVGATGAVPGFASENPPLAVFPPA